MLLDGSNDGPPWGALLWDSLEKSGCGPTRGDFLGPAWIWLLRSYNLYAPVMAEAVGGTHDASDKVYASPICVAVSSGLHHLIHKTDQGVHKGNDYEQDLE